MTYIDRARGQHDRLIAIRRDLHRHPELAFQEVRTARRIAETLHALGIEYETEIAQTGVIAVIGKGTPCIALRADMDALPILEANDVEFRSQNIGVMHACGHDSHTTCLLGAAMLLNQDFAQGKLRGSVKLLFQPAEELYVTGRKSGGQLMVEEGVLDGVDAVVGLHVIGTLPANEVHLRAGPFMAAVDNFEGDVIGLGGHGAYPHEALDPVWLSAQVVNATHGIVARRMDPTKPSLISVCTVSGGNAMNIIPESVHLAGTIRCFDECVAQQLHADLERAFAITRAWSGDYRLKITRGYPATVNDAEMVHLVRQAAGAIVGAAQVKEAELQMGGEDFSYMARAKPGAFFFLGAQKDAIRRPLHSPIFDIDEAVLATGAACLAETACRFIEERRKLN